MSDNTVFLEYGSFSVYWYGLFMAMAVFLAAILFSVFRKLQGNSFVSGLSVSLISMSSALVLSRVFYCWFAKASFVGGIKDYMDLSKGGYALYGALLGIVAVLAVYSYLKEQSFTELLDAAAPAILLATAVGRFASILSNDDIGFELTSQNASGMPYAIWSSTDNAWILWVGYFEGMIAAAAFVFTSVIFFLKYRCNAAGFTSGGCALVFMLMYGYSQAILESMRNDSLFMITLGFVRISQIISIVMAVAATVILSVRTCRLSKPKTAHVVVWVGSVACLGAAVYCEFKMNALQMFQNYLIMGLSLGFMLGGSLFLFFYDIRLRASLPKEENASVEKDDILPAKLNNPRRNNADGFDNDLDGGFSDDFDDDLDNGMSDGFDDDLHNGMSDGFDDDLDNGFSDGFDDDLDSGFSDDFGDDLNSSINDSLGDLCDDDFDEEFIRYFGLEKKTDRSQVFRLAQGQPVNNGNDGIQPQRRKDAMAFRPQQRAEQGRPMFNRNNGTQPQRQQHPATARSQQRPAQERPMYSRTNRTPPQRRQEPTIVRSRQRPAQPAQGETPRDNNTEEAREGVLPKYSGYIDPLPEINE